jgi:hypothetical protein
MAAQKLMATTDSEPVKKINNVEYTISDSNAKLKTKKATWML